MGGGRGVHTRGRNISERRVVGEGGLMVLLDRTTGRPGLPCRYTSMHGKGRNAFTKCWLRSPEEL